MNEPAAVELVSDELARSRTRLAAVLDRTSALAELLAVAIELEDRRNDGKPPRARRALPFDELNGHQGDEETKARIAALFKRIAPPEEGEHDAR